MLSIVKRFFHEIDVFVLLFERIVCQLDAVRRENRELKIVRDQAKEQAENEEKRKTEDKAAREEMEKRMGEQAAEVYKLKRTLTLKESELADGQADLERQKLEHVKYGCMGEAVPLGSCV